MRTLIAGLLILGCLGASTSTAAAVASDEMWSDQFGGYYAASDNVLPGMYKKALRGVTNLVTGIVEWPMQTYKGYHNGMGFIKNKPLSKGVGTVVGFLFSGPGQAGARVVWGGTELIGFWTANRESNDGVGVPCDAQFAWQMGKKYDMFAPSLKEGVKPIGRKLVYGLADGFLGIVELPSQIVVGVKDGNVATGVCKGFWFWWSREIYGMGGIAAIPCCLLSNPADNPGYAYKGEWPWSGLVGK
jgi:hypothetical protein